MKALPSRSRITLIGIALGLVAADIYWLGRIEPAPGPDFNLDLSGVTINFSGKDRRDVPLFDPVRRRWMLKGAEPPSLHPLLLHSWSDVAPMTNGDYVVVSLPLHATAAIFKQALIALTNDGICNFVVIDEEDKGTPKVYSEGSVYTIRTVKSDAGTVVRCHQKGARELPQTL